MLTIRAEQLEALNGGRDAALVQAIGEIVRAELPDLAAPFSPPAFDARIAEAVKRGRGHGLADEWDLYRFTEQHLRLGPDFDASPWAAPILASPALTPAQKMDRVDYHVARVLGRT